MDDLPTLISGLIAAMAALAILVAMWGWLALQAKRRGYSFWLWLMMAFVAFNPVFFLVLLAILPNRMKQRRRELLRAALDDKLAALGDQRPRRDSSVSFPGSPASSTLRGERSLGDLPTMASPERSLGDVETME